MNHIADKILQSNGLAGEVHNKFVASEHDILKVIYHHLYGMNNYVLIWGDWLSCDPLRGSHDSRSPHVWG